MFQGVVVNQFDEELYTYDTKLYTQLSRLRVTQPTEFVEVYDVPGEDFDAIYSSGFNSNEELQDLAVWTSGEVTTHSLEIVDDDFLRSRLASLGPFSFTIQTDSPALLVEPESSILLRVRVREGAEYLRVNGWIGGQLLTLFEARNKPEEWFHLTIELRAHSGAEISKIEVNIAGRDSGGVDIDYLALLERDSLRMDVERSPEGILISAEAPFEVMAVAKYDCCPMGISIDEEREPAPDAVEAFKGKFRAYSLPPGESRLMLRYRDETFSMYPLLILVLIGIQAAVIALPEEGGEAPSPG